MCGDPLLSGFDVVKVRDLDLQLLALGRQDGFHGETGSPTPPLRWKS
jgi:hypothetical protein